MQRNEDIQYLKNLTDMGYNITETITVISLFFGDKASAKKVHAFGKVLRSTSEFFDTLEE